MNNKEIDCELSDHIICPWCGYEDQDSDYEFHQGTSRIWCANCEREITVFENVSITYTSRKGH